MASAAGRAPAFLVPILIAAFFGAGRSTDAYFIAYSAVLLLGGTLAQGVEQAVVPFAATEIQRSGGAPHRYLDRAAARIILAAALLWAVGIPAVAIAAPDGLRVDVVSYAIAFSPLTLAWCGASVFGGALVSQWRIGAATGSMLIRGSGALLGLATTMVGGGLWSVAAGLSVGELARLWWLRRHVSRSITQDTGGAAPASLTGLERAAAAQCGASAAIGAVPLVERMLALSLGVGTASYLEYATRLLVLPGVLFEGALAPLLLARWTSEVTVLGRAPSRRDVLRSVSKGMVLATACAGLLAAFAPLIVDLLLRHGRFTGSDAEAVAALLRLYALAFIATMAALLMERFYLATVRNRTLAVLSLGRAALRLGTVLALLTSRGMAAFPLGYALADWAYLLVLLRLGRHVKAGTVPATSTS